MIFIRPTDHYNILYCAKHTERLAEEKMKNRYEETYIHFIVWWLFKLNKFKNRFTSKPPQFKTYRNVSTLCGRLTMNHREEYQTSSKSFIFSNQPIYNIIRERHFLSVVKIILIKKMLEIVFGKFEIRFFFFFGPLNAKNIFFKLG